MGAVTAAGSREPSLLRPAPTLSASAEVGPPSPGAPSRWRLCRDARARRCALERADAIPAHHRTSTRYRCKPPRAPGLPTARRGPTAHGAVGPRRFHLRFARSVPAHPRSAAKRVAACPRQALLGGGRCGICARQNQASLSPKYWCPGWQAPLRLESHTVRYRERTCSSSLRKRCGSAE